MRGRLVFWQGRSPNRAARVSKQLANTPSRAGLVFWQDGSLAVTAQNRPARVSKELPETRRYLRVRVLRFAFLLCWVWLAGCAKQEASPVVRFVSPPDSIAHLPVYLAHSLGYFQQEGVNVQLEYLNAVPKVMEALLGGSADIGAGTYEQTIRLAAEGPEIRSFVILSTRYSPVIVAAPGAPLRSIKDLKGSTVGVPALGAPIHSLLNLALYRAGLSPADVRAAGIGIGAPALAAMEHRKVDAAVLLSAAYEQFLSRHSEVTVLVDARTAEGSTALFGAPEVAAGSVFASSRWLASNPDTARRLARALVRTSRWIREQPLGQVMASVPQFFQTPGSHAGRRTLETALSSYSTTGLMPPGSPDIVKKYIEVTTERPVSVDLSKTYTDEFVKESS